jgi:hypothetical protein
MPQPQVIADGTWALFLVPVLLVFANIAFKALNKADPYFAGADLALCGCSMLLTWLARAIGRGTLPPTGEAVWAFLYSIISLLVWFLCLKVSALKKSTSLFGAAVIGGTQLFVSARYVYHLTQRGF